MKLIAGSLLFLALISWPAVGQSQGVASPAPTSMATPQLSQDEIRFLAEIKKFSTTLSDGDKRLVLAMIRKMATLIPPAATKKLIVRRPTV